MLVGVGEEVGELVEVGVGDGVDEGVAEADGVGPAGPDRSRSSA